MYVKGHSLHCLRSSAKERQDFASKEFQTQLNFKTDICRYSILLWEWQDAVLGQPFRDFVSGFNCQGFKKLGPKPIFLVSKAQVMTPRWSCPRLVGAQQAQHFALCGKKIRGPTDCLGFAILKRKIRVRYVRGAQQEQAGRLGSFA